jgi:phospho-N-acetylmuramoyl-pentapeptide-transferase
MYRIIVAGVVSLVLGLVLGPILIRFLKREGIGQQVREDGPERHLEKSGTPTMGGVLIVISMLIAFLIGILLGGSPNIGSVFSATTLAGIFHRLALYVEARGASFFVLGTVLLCAAVGFIDDFIKTSRARSLGLTARWKTLLLFFISLFLTWGAIHFGKPPMAEVGIGQIGVTLNLGVFYFAFIFLVLFATTTAVNFTDGLDGLASGTVALIAAVYAAICFLQFRHLHFAYGLDLAIFSTAVAGACGGFLWFNSYPADIFMGDTGAFALGGAIAALAVFTKTEILLILVGGLLVVETLSVIIQVISFRLFKRRVFKMAPLHHHFELLGWSEFEIVVRFWVIASILAASGFSIFYTEIMKLG